MAAVRAAGNGRPKTGSARVTCPVILESVTELTPSFRRVVISGEGLSAYDPVLPADAFKLFLPPGGGGNVDFPAIGADGLPYWPEGTRQPTLRPYTVRSFDSATNRITFDVFTHHDIPWLRNTRPGDVLGLGGMRHGFAGAGTPAHHLMVADASALPAVAAILEALDAAATVTAYLEAPTAADRVLVPERPGVSLHWTTGTLSAGADSPLERAVRAGGVPAAVTRAWIAAEFGVARALRHHARHDLAVDQDGLHAVAYWKVKLTSDERDAEDLVRYRKAVEDGLDITDPRVVDAIEFPEDTPTPAGS